MPDELPRKLTDEERRERDAAARRAWWDAHPDYKKDWNSRNRERINEHERVASQKRKERAAKEDERRQKQAEYRKEWAAKNPEKHKEYVARYRAANAERILAMQRASYARNREAVLKRQAEQRAADPDYAAKVRARRSAAPEKVAEYNKRYIGKPGNYEKVLEYNREWKRRERARQKAGLPPKARHRSTKLEKQQNAAAADAFFARPRTKKEIAALRSDARQLRHRARENYSPMTRDELAEWTRTSAIARARFTPEQRMKSVQRFLARHGAELAEEVRMDSRARELRGLPPYSLDIEVLRRAITAVAGEERAKVDRAVNRAMAAFATPPNAAAIRPADARPPSPPQLPPRSPSRSHRER